MKNLITFCTIFLTTTLMLSSCGSTSENEDESKVEVTPETTEKVKQAQDANVELESIDGELDSLIITIK